MKKTALALTGVLLAGSLCALTACGESGDIGKIEGNYEKAATGTELQTALESVDLENAFVSGTSFGFKAEAAFDFNTTMGSVSQKGSFSLNYTLAGSALAIAGKGSVKVSMQGLSESSKLSATVYHDTTTVYLDANMDGVKAKYKVSVQELIDLIGNIGEDTNPDIGWGEGGYMPMAEEADGSVDEVPSENDSWSTIVTSPDAMLNEILQAGFTPYIDDTDGLKIKFEGGKSFLEGILDEAEIPAESATFTSSVCDVYIAFDKDGAFTKLGVDVDIAIDMGYGSGVSIKGGMAITAYSGTVTLPSGIENDENYLYFPISQMF